MKKRKETNHLTQAQSDRIGLSVRAFALSGFLYSALAAGSTWFVPTIATRGRMYIARELQPGFDSSSSKIAGAACSCLVCLYPRRANERGELSRTRDGRRRIVLPILPSSMTLGDDHREGANVLFPPALPVPRFSYTWVPSRFVASCAPPSLPSLPRFPCSLLPVSFVFPPRVPYARVIITAAIRHASLATLCPGESSRRGTTIARETAEEPMTLMMLSEWWDIAMCYRGILKRDCAEIITEEKSAGSLFTCILF